MCAPPSLSAAPNPTENKTTVATWFTCHGFGHSTDFSLGFNSKSVPGKGTDQLQLEGKDIIITKTVTALNPVGRGQQTGRGTQRSWGVGQAEMAVCFPQGHFGLLPGGHAHPGAPQMPDVQRGPQFSSLKIPH